MAESSTHLRKRLKGLGLSNDAITAVWPRWWSDAADESASARVQLYFSVARRLGIDPRSLVDAEARPRFIWREEARFKNLTGEGTLEQAGITSFGRSVSAVLLAASPDPPRSLEGTSAETLRATLLQGRPFVGMSELLSLTWGFGIPVAHLRVFPWTQKRMAAMTTRPKERSAILLGRDSNYPPQIVFYLAHEIAHIALGHVSVGDQIVDLESDQLLEGDDEEKAADEFALILLTGEPRPVVRPLVEGYASAAELARVAVESAEKLQIEPGVIAMLYGYSTADWEMAQAGVKRIYDAAEPMWRRINEIARAQLDLDRLPDESAEFLDAVLGWTED